MYRIENGHGQVIVKATELNAAIKMAIELGKDKIGQMIDDSDDAWLALDSSIQVRYYPENKKIVDVCCFSIEIGEYDYEYDKDGDYLVKTRYTVVFEG